MGSMVKRLKIKGLIVAVAMAFAVATGGVTLAATTGQLILSGIVGQILILAVNGLSAASNLNLNTNQSALLHVANVVAFSNSEAGYEVTVESANLMDGHCASAITPCFYSSTTQEALNYTLYSGSTPLGFEFNKSTYAVEEDKTPATGKEFQAQITFNGSGANLSEASNYVDTLTFTIVKQ